MRLLFVFIIAGLLTAGVGYAGLYTSKQKKYLQDMRPVFAGVQIVQSTPQGIAANVFLKLSNHSDMDITITTQHYDILINNEIVQQVDRTTPLVIKANGDTTATFPIVFQPKQVLNDIFQGLLDQARVLPGLDNVTIGIRGTVSVEGAFVLVDKFKFTLTRPLKEVLTNFMPNILPVLSGIGSLIPTPSGNFAGFQNPASAFRVPLQPLSLDNPPIVNKQSVIGQVGAIASL